MKLICMPSDEKLKYPAPSVYHCFWDLLEYIYRTRFMTSGLTMNVQEHSDKSSSPSLKRNIQLLESASGCFTCFTCTHSKITGGSDSNQSYISTSQFQHMRIHWNSRHHNSVTIMCDQCLNNFSTLSQWGEHIKSYSCSIVHCTFPGCFVKSPSRALILDHIRLKHSKFSTPKEQTVFPLFQETSELICNRLIKLDSVSKSVTTSFTAVDQLPPMNIMCTDLCPPFVFLLRCPYCDLTTVRWTYFLMHPASCSGIRAFVHNRQREDGTQLPLIYRCHIYWCSKCQVVSTEQKLLTEHVTYSHNPKEASVYREHWRVSLLDDNSEPIITGLSVNLERDLESSKDADDMLPPFSTTEDDANDDEETESPMNLAALARPSSSKLGNRAQQTIPNNFPTLSVSKSSTNDNCTGVSNSLTSVSANLHMNNSTALKTFRNFTVAQDVGSFPTCNAASAVAAMAAAALSGLTSFNMNNAVSHSINPFSTSLPCDISSPIPIQPKPSTLPAEVVDPVQGNEEVNKIDTEESKYADSLDSSAKSPADEYLSSDDAGRVCDGLVSFPFDECKFRSELSTQLRPHIIDLLVSKMKQFSSYFVRILGKENHRRIPVCPECDKVFPYGLGDFKRHLLTVHLEVPREHLKDCLRFTYLPKSEEKFQEVQEQIAMRQMKPRVLEAGRRRVPLPYSIRILRRFKNESNGANSTPIPPDFRNSDPLTSADLSSSHINGNLSLCQPSMSPFECGAEHQTTSSNTNSELASLPSIPGIEGADRVVDLALPFSEPVLRHLLESSGAPERHIEDIVGKMRVYSTYKMSRICRNDRTIAFRCPCGRLFITTRQPDSKIRAATLADSRRHVMGVHARIPNVFITICCQASRITREYDFQIYPDDMLLRLAMDRPIKLNNLPVPAPSDVNTSNTNGRSSSNNFSKPLKELAPYPIVATIAPQQPINTNSVSSSPRTQILDVGEADSVSEGTDTGGTSGSINHDESFTKYENSENDDNKESSDIDPKRVQKEPEDPLAQLNAVQASGSEEVERVIDLPYSSEALKTLVQGYCPPNFFPVLEAKMGVYSSLKVYITRRRGRRYFCCSGCSSSSPHGMGDIRKHILGVHAKVPERYKAAAMHCSRLSREDNTLLPNHVLLHLAKMKWKGTVIKPLSEMDLTQFGSRRASAVGLSRPSGQFASQVYQPTVHREVEKLVNINRVDHLPSSASQYSMNKSLSKISVQEADLIDENGMKSNKSMDLPDDDGTDDHDNEEVSSATADNDEIDLPELPSSIFDNSSDFQLDDDTFELSKPAKIPRLNDDTVVVFPLPVNVSNTPIVGIRNKPSITPSGSSRRKPNKMQLVQLRPDHYSESNFSSIHSISPIENSIVSMPNQQSSDTTSIHPQVIDVDGNGIVTKDCDHLTKVSHPLNSIQSRIGV
ncbi:unnamed protein product [Heterobilharzia americana]|nr:unnamed protein product [Heterobilharzia americana]